MLEAQQRGTDLFDEDGVCFAERRLADEQDGRTEDSGVRAEDPVWAMRELVDGECCGAQVDEEVCVDFESEFGGEVEECGGHLGTLTPVMRKES